MSLFDMYFKYFNCKKICSKKKLRFFY